MGQTCCAESSNDSKHFVYNIINKPVSMGSQKYAPCAEPIVNNQKVL